MKTTSPEDKLQHILNSAVDNSPYYRKLRGTVDITNIKSFPLLNKSDVHKNKAEILNTHYSNVMLKECVMHLSSGTMGIPIEVYWHHNDEMKSNLSIWRLRLKFYDIKPSDKCCTLHTTNYSWNRTNDYKDITYSQDRKTLSLCKLFLDDEHLKKYYDEVIRFRPDWLFFQPSFFIKFTDFMQKNKLPLPLFIKYIEFTGETLNSLAVQYVNQYYKCSYSNMYGTTETGTIGYMCPCGKMHVLNDNVYLEVIPEKQYCSTEIGKAIVTSLNNNIFPLIRYDIGDIVSMSYCNNCGCGLSGQIIEEIVGRENNCVTLADGKIISESTVMSIFDRVNTLTGNKIKEYKAIINNKLSTINFIIYIDSKFKFWEREILNGLKEVINTRFNFEYKVEFMYEPLCVNSSGKFSIVEVI